jgi:hypothetical protein
LGLATPSMLLSSYTYQPYISYTEHLELSLLSFNSNWNDGALSPTLLCDEKLWSDILPATQQPERKIGTYVA